MAIELKLESAGKKDLYFQDVGADEVHNVAIRYRHITNCNKSIKVAVRGGKVYVAKTKRAADMIPTNANSKYQIEELFENA